VQRQELPGHAVGPEAKALKMRWPSEAIWEAIVPTLENFTVEIVLDIDSTNSELMRRARAGQLDPILLVAERQTAGRGRLGRTWHSGGVGVEGIPALTFSLGLPLSPQSWSGLSLAVGVSVAQSLHPSLQLKWPNDIWLNDRKLAGILIETATVNDVRYAVIGIGINIAPRAAAGLSTPPAWLQEVQPGMDSGLALQRIAKPLVQAIQKFAQTGFAPFQADFHALDLLAGRAVTLSDGSSGQALGVDAAGGLRVKTAGGAVQTITSAEVSVRPAAESTSSPASKCLD
jgi:BirA family transcriptional regulator, biotin operon repressor / biotin---[acetyl-CoA-carboxylase] ligase